MDARLARSHPPQPPQPKIQPASYLIHTSSPLKPPLTRSYVRYGITNLKSPSAKSPGPTRPPSVRLDSLRPNHKNLSPLVILPKRVHERVCVCVMVIHWLAVGLVEVLVTPGAMARLVPIKRSRGSYPLFIRKTCCWRCCGSRALGFSANLAMAAMR